VGSEPSRIASSSSGPGRRGSVEHRFGHDVPQPDVRVPDGAPAALDRLAATNDVDSVYEACLRAATGLDEKTSRSTPRCAVTGAPARASSGASGSTRHASCSRATTLRPLKIGTVSPSGPHDQELFTQDRLGGISSLIEAEGRRPISRAPPSIAASGRQDLNLRPLDPQNLHSAVSARHKLVGTEHHVTFAQVVLDSPQRSVSRRSQARPEHARYADDARTRPTDSDCLSLILAVPRRSPP
jgi:hypothetical protein